MDVKDESDDGTNALRLANADGLADVDSALLHFRDVEAKLVEFIGVKTRYVE